MRNVSISIIAKNKSILALNLEQSNLCESEDDVPQSPELRSFRHWALLCIEEVDGPDMVQLFLRRMQRSGNTTMYSCLCMVHGGGQ